MKNLHKSMKQDQETKKVLYIQPVCGQYKIHVPTVCDGMSESEDLTD